MDKFRLLATLVVTLTFGISPFAISAKKSTEEQAADLLYRYRNEAGVVVIDYSIPPKYAAKGYEVISPSGRVLETVSPQTDKPVEDQVAIKAQEEQKKEDAYILRSYSTLEDIGRAKQRRLIQLDREIAILSSSLSEYERRRVELTKRAAAYQASGQELPENVRSSLEELEAQKISSQKQLANMGVQRDEVDKRFSHYAARLKLLRPGVATVNTAVSETAPGQ